MEHLEYLSPYVRFAKSSFFNRSKTKYLSVEHSNFLIFVTEGKYVHIVNDQRIVMEPGMLLLIPPFTNQVLGGCLTETVRIAIIDFDLFDCDESRTVPHLDTSLLTPDAEPPRHRRVREQELLLAEFPMVVRLTEPSWKRVLECYTVVAENFKSRSLPVVLHVKSCMLEILSRFLSGTPIIGVHGKPDASRYRSEIIRYVDLNFHNSSLSVTEIAAHLGLSLAYLSRLAKRELGCTLSEYITSVRIRKAKELLALGKRISDAATECGFLSLQAFSRTFRRVAGISPRKYIENLSEE